jgi:hypothetical protein
MTDHIPAGGPVEDPPPPERFDPAAILRSLNEHGVRYVVIGGVAATLHGAPVVTYDLDLTPQQSRDNITRLAAALTSIGALRYTDPDLPFATPGPEDFEYLVESFASPLGYIDVFREVQAIGGYDQLRPNALDTDVDGIQIAIASLDDVIASKRATDRPKDRMHLTLLLPLVGEIGRSPAAELDR